MLLFDRVSQVVIEVFVTVVVTRIFRRFNEHVTSVRQRERVANLLRHNGNVVSTRVYAITLQANDRVRRHFNGYGPYLEPTCLRRHVRNDVHRRRHVQVHRSRVLTYASRRSPNSGLQVFATLCRAHRPMRHHVEIATSGALSRNESSIVVRLTLLVVDRQVLLRLFLCRLVNGGRFVTTYEFRRRFRSVRRFPNVATARTRRNYNFLRLGLLLLRFRVLNSNSLRRPLRIFLLRQFRRVRLTAKGRQASCLREKVFHNDAGRNSGALLRHPRREILLALKRTVGLVGGWSEEDEVRRSTALHSLCRLTRVLCTANGNEGNMRESLRNLNCCLHRDDLTRSQESPRGGEKCTPYICRLTRRNALTCRVLLSSVVNRQTESRSFDW